MVAPSRLSAESQQSLVDYAKRILEFHQKLSTEMATKMEGIDRAYYRYKEAVGDGTHETSNGVDLANTATGAAISIDDITIPIVISQVDSFKGYFADVFLSGFPMFPVVTSPANKEKGEQLEAIMDNHAVIGGYPRQMLMFFGDALRYNFAGIGCEWHPLDSYQADIDIKSVKAGVTPVTAYYNKIWRLNPYNTVWDYRVLPADVSAEGEFVGEILLQTSVQMRKKLIRFQQSTDGYNTGQAKYVNSGTGAGAVAPKGPGGYVFYRDVPNVSGMGTLPANRHTFDWGRDVDTWLNPGQKKKNKDNGPLHVPGMYEYFRFYARIVPAQHKINTEKPFDPQIWEICVIVNNWKLVYARRVPTVYDRFPINLSQPFEDGFSIQTQSVAELSMPFQDAGSKLLNIRLNASRRAVNDRAIYDSNVFNEDDVNSNSPAPKIPMKANSLIGGKTIDSVYKSIPFESRGTDGVLQDLGTLLALGEKGSGLNKPQQGEFQKGNKSVREWTDTMAGSDNRLRLPAITMEFQVFVPLKEQIKLNIFQHQPLGSYTNMNKGDTYQVTAETLADIRKSMVAFKIADGLTPASKMASTEVITGGMQMIGNSPILQQSWGPALPAMFAHLMSLGGVKGLAEYLPKTPQPIDDGGTK